MSGLLGTQLEEDYIQVGDIKLPLPKSPHGRAEEYETLRTTPLEPFQASVVIGDDSLISDDRIAQAVFSDFRPGLGKRRYTEVEGITGYQDGDLLTVEGNAVTLPPYRQNLIGTLVAAVATPSAPGICVTGFGYDWAATRYRFAAWAPQTSRIYIADFNAGGAMVTPTTIPNAVPPYSAFAYFANRYVACVTTGVYYSTDGQAFTTSWVPGGTLVCWGLIVHDTKLYVIVGNTANNSFKLYWVATQAQLIAGVAWPGVSVEEFQLDPGEVVTNVVDWKDKQDDRQIFIGTNKRIVSYADADFFTTFWPVPNYNSAYRPFLCVNPRDDLLYVAFGGQNDSVFVFNHQTIEEQGPNREFGIDYSASSFTGALLVGNSRHMFMLGVTTGSPGTQGRVLIANDSFGWSPFARGRRAVNSDLNSAATAGEVITGMFYFSDRLVIIRSSGQIEYVDWPDKALSAYTMTPFAPWGRSYDPLDWWLFSAEFDKGNELLWALAKYWTIHLEGQAGTYALPASTSLFFKYQYDGGAWSATTTLTNANTFPYRIPLPSLSDQRGDPFRKVRFAVGLQGPGAVNYVTSILRAVTLAYTREPDIYDGLQCVVDLSRERFDQLPNALFYGLDRQALRNYIDTLKSGPGVAKRHYPVTVGWAGYQKVYASCDVRVSGVEDPSSRFGHYSLTMREVTAPVSG